MSAGRLKFSIKIDYDFQVSFCLCLGIGIVIGDADDGLKGKAMSLSGLLY